MEKLHQSHAHLEELAGQLKQAMRCVEVARERRREVEERLAREERVLEEREEAYRKLLVQLGQDTAISEEHSRLVARQRQRVADLRKVGALCCVFTMIKLHIMCSSNLSLVCV